MNLLAQILGNRGFMMTSIKTNRENFIQGMRDGIPIALGYLAVSFSLGIAARNIGMNALQGFIVSFLNNASAGEYAGFTVIGSDASYIEIILVTLIANARYLLMSCALSQKFHPSTKLIHRMLVGYDVTDEIFGISIAREGYLNPFYTYGAISIAAPAWAFGTAIGVAVGNILPADVVSALGVALFGMFIAIIIPPAKKDRIVGGLIALCFVSSYAFSVLPAAARFSEGTRTIILTVIISAAAAIIFPKKEESDNEA